MTRSLLLAFVAAFGLATTRPTFGEIRVLEPTPYLSAADSPFDMSGLGTTFFLEDFEDDVLELPPGTLSIAHIITEPGPLTDSVDGDDGLQDGDGTGGHSLKSIAQYVNPSFPPITNTVFVFRFDEQQLGFLPKSFGFVWTDGMPSSRLSVLVLEPNAQGGRVFQPLMDLSYSGQTAEDRFIGFTSTTGIREVSIENQVRTFSFVDQFEIDHVQFGRNIPEGTSGIAAILAGALMAWSSRVPARLSRRQLVFFSTMRSMNPPLRVLGVLSILVAMSTSSLATVTFFPPIPYLSVADSPFDMSGLGNTFFFEDFEDETLDLPPGWVAQGLDIVREPGEFTDSVDADDDAIDGSGIGGHSLRTNYIYANLTAPPEWNTVFGATFDRSQLGFVPNAIGFVWTDGVPGSHLVISAREADGSQAGMSFFDPLMDQFNSGETSEDRFFGLTSDVGFLQINITNKFHSWTFINEFEIDHIQYGLQVVPEPGSRWLIAAWYLLLTCGRFQVRLLVRRGVTCNDDEPPPPAELSSLAAVLLGDNWRSKFWSHASARCLALSILAPS